MHNDKFYAVKNDKGEFAHIEMDKLTWETGFATVWLSLNKSYAKRAANDYGGHVVELAEKHAPVVVSQEQADDLKQIAVDAHEAELHCEEFRATFNDPRILRAYVTGWEVEPEAKWYVQTPKEWWEDKSKPEYIDLDSMGISDGLKCKEYAAQFTRDELKKYRLDNDIFTLVPVGDEK